MQFGRSYEEFEVGATYKHWPGKTVTEFDDHMFCLLTMNHHPLHLDEHYAEETTQFGKNVVVGNYVYSILLGMSVPDISGKAIANLEIESLRHVAPTFHGDTLYGETTRARQVGEQEQGRPGRRARRDHRLQPGRQGGLHLPAQGDGAQGQLPRGPRRRAARPAGAAAGQELARDPRPSDPCRRSELWMVRHGETEWSRDGRHTSTTELAADPGGRSGRAPARRAAGRAWTSTWC